MFCNLFSNITCYLIERMYFEVFKLEMDDFTLNTFDILKKCHRSPVPS